METKYTRYNKSEKGRARERRRQERMTLEQRVRKALRNRQRKAERRMPGETFFELEREPWTSTS